MVGDFIVDRRGTGTLPEQTVRDRTRQGWGITMTTVIVENQPTGVSPIVDEKCQK